MQPQRFGKYLLLDRISVGGMAEVFKARLFGVEGFARFIAIKRILPHLAEDDRFVEMFIDEAKTSVLLSHANIAQVIELGREGEAHFIAMEYVPGRDLLALYKRARQRRVAIPVHQVAYIGHQVAEGLDYAHRKRSPDGQHLAIVHRDISPQNVLVSYDGAVKLIDFGIAKARGQNYKKKKGGALRGKFAYMSPELIEGKNIDARSDIFALGIVLWELLTSETLFHGDNEFVTMERVRQAVAVPPSHRNPAVPPDLDQIVLTALARDRHQRYQTAAEMAEDLGRFLHTHGFSSNRKTLSAWVRIEFQAEYDTERTNASKHARITLTPDGHVIEAAPEDDEEPTALWTPEDGNGQAGDWATATAEPASAQAVVDPLADLERAPHFSAPPRVFTHSQLPQPQIADRATGSALQNQPTADIHERPTAPLPANHVSSLNTGQTIPASNRLALAAASAVIAALLAVLAWWFLGRPPRPATLSIEVRPPGAATVHLGKTLLGRSTPMDVPGIKPGRYPLRIMKEGFKPHEAVIDLVSGETTAVSATLVKDASAAAVLTFQVDPKGAKIEVDGRGIGSKGIQIDPGREVTVKVTHTGFIPLEVKVRTRPGQQRLRYALEATPGTLFIDSDPPGDVYLDGRRIGRAPQNVPKLDVRRPWTVQVKSPGFKPWQQVVRFGDRRFVQVEGKLVKAP